MPIPDINEFFPDKNSFWDWGNGDVLKAAKVCGQACWDERGKEESAKNCGNCALNDCDHQMDFPACKIVESIPREARGKIRCDDWEIEKQDTRSAIYDPGVFAPCKVYLIQAPLRFSFRCEKFELWEEQ